jgi:hypothetical protein
MMMATAQAIERIKPVNIITGIIIMKRRAIAGPLIKMPERVIINLNVVTRETSVNDREVIEETTTTSQDALNTIQAGGS